MQQNYLLSASLTATAQATVIPTIGLLPAPIRPIISTHFETVDKRLFHNKHRTDTCHFQYRLALNKTPVKHGSFYCITKFGIYEIVQF